MCWGCLGCCPRRCVDLCRRRLDHRLVIVFAEVPPIGRGLVLGAPPWAARVVASGRLVQVVGLIRRLIVEALTLRRRAICL